MTRFFSLFLLLYQGILLVGIAGTSSLNRTEVAHLGAAAYFWQTGQFDLFNVNPPLGRMIIGLPIYLSGPEYDFSKYSPRPQDRSEWQVGQSFAAANSPQNVRLMVFLGWGATLCPDMMAASLGMIAVYCFKK